MLRQTYHHFYISARKKKPQEVTSPKSFSNLRHAALTLYQHVFKYKSLTPAFHVAQVNYAIVSLLCRMLRVPVMQPRLTQHSCVNSQTGTEDRSLGTQVQKTDLLGHHRVVLSLTVGQVGIKTPEVPSNLSYAVIL